MKQINPIVPPTADEIPFDNTGTSLVSTDVEGAIKEVAVITDSDNGSLPNLSSYTGKTLVEAVLASGSKIKYFSTTGGNRLSDLPIIQAGRYVVYADTYYKQIEFTGTNGVEYLYNYDGNTWILTSSIVKTSTEVTGSPSVNINVPSSGNYIGYIYLSPYISTGVQTGGGAYAIKNYNGRVHLTEIKQASGVTVSSITVNTGSVTVTFNTNLSSFIQAVVFKL